MVVISVASFERFFREAADLDVDKTDLKRFQAFAGIERTGRSTRDGRGASPKCRRAGSPRRRRRSYNLRSTVSSLDSQTNSEVRMTLLGVFA
jgi:hypothetical protein